MPRSSTSPSTAVFMRSYKISAGTPPSASKAAIWQRSTAARSWRSTKRAHIRRLWPSTRENSQTIRSAPGYLPEQATAVEIGKGGDPLAQIGFDRGDDSRPRVTRTIARRFQAAFNVFGNGRTIHPGAPGDRGEGEALPMKIQDHYEFPECDHRRTSLPVSMGRMVHDGPTPGADTLEVGLLGHLRDFTAPDLSSIHPASTPGPWSPGCDGRAAAGWCVDLCR